MTLVSGTVEDIGFDPVDGTLWARPARFRSDGGVVRAPERTPYPIVGGQVSVTLAPGPAVLELRVGSHARGTFEVVIPEEEITLADLLDTVFPWEPEQVSLFVAERQAAEQAKSDALQAKGAAETAAGNASSAASQTEQDRTAVAADKQVVLGHVQALAAPNDAAVLGLISEGATTQTKAALNATYGTKAEVQAKLDEATLPAKTATNIAADQAVRDEVARAAIAPSTMGLASTIIARNAADTPLPQMVTLLNGSAAQVPVAASTHTFTNVPSPTDPTRTVWRAQGNFNQTIRARTNFAAPVNVAPATALTAWVYLPTLTNFVSLSILAYCTDGTWVRATNQTPARALRQGWNLVRFGTNFSLHNALASITGVEVRATLAAGVTGTHEMLIGPMVAEKRPKASVVMINDWGNKAFHTNAYPALQAAGIPVTWAVRVGSLGTGTYPNNHITLAEAETLMGENGNVVSFHSWDGDATASMTAKQARDQVLRCQAGLSARGLWSEGAAHRPAWVQNMAPGAPGAAPYLATAGSYEDSYQATTWPPLNRLSIPRVAIYHPVFDAQFDVMRDIRGVGLFYTHGVVATSGEAGANHATQAQFDHFLSRVTTGISEGWLEAVTIPQLAARERLTMPTLPPAAPALTF